MATHRRVRSRSPFKLREEAVASSSSSEAIQGEKNKADNVSIDQAEQSARVPGRTRGRKVKSIDVEKILAMMEENGRDIDIEQDRRRGLGIEGRLKEDGERLIRLITESQTKILLQVTPQVNYGQWAQCRAGVDCFVGHLREADPDKMAMFNSTGVSPRVILDGYRIRVDEGEWARRHQYYHVACFDKMADLPALVPDWFEMDCSVVKSISYDPIQWGLLIREWFQQRGRINLDKLESYIEEEDYYQETMRQMEKMQKSDTCTCKELEGCALIHPPERPVLKDFTTGPEEICSLVDVLRHEYSERMQGQYIVTDVFSRGGVVRYPENKHEDGREDNGEPAGEGDAEG
ncbi:hypothetical protein ACJZ2D_016495 [Fusarium nematophilum]